MFRIYDTSIYLHAGKPNLKYKGIPTGGLFYLLRELIGCVKKRDIPILVFDSRSNSKSIYPEYKANRVANPDVILQSEIAYEYLKEVIPNTFKIQGYEADWIAAAIFDKLVQTTKGNEIVGHTDDNDWAHNIQNDRTFITAATINGKFISTNNFEAVYSTREVNVPLNVITMYKVLFGDKSDNVSPFKSYTAYTNAQFLIAYIQFCKKRNLDNRLKDSALEFVDYIKSSFSQEILDNLLARINIFYPRKLDNLSEISYEYVDSSKFSKILSLTGCKKLSERSGIKFQEDMGELQTDILKKYQAIKGEFAETRYFCDESNKDIIIKDRGGFV